MLYLQRTTWSSTGPALDSAYVASDLGCLYSRNWRGFNLTDLGSHISILLVQEAVTPSGRPCGLDLLLLGRSSLESIFLEVPVQRKLLGVA